MFSFCLDFLLFFVLEPDDEVLQQNKMYFEDRVQKMKDGELSEDEEEKSDASKKVKSKEEYILRYEQLCRGNSSKVQKYF